MKFTINFSANVVAFLLSVFLSVWMTPFIVKTLGVEAFGFVHLTQNVINYFSIITVALSSVVVRFFSVAAHRGKLEEANGYLSNYLAASVILSLLLFLPLTGAAFFIETFINVPAALLADVRLSILIGSVLFVLTFFMAGFATGPFYANRLYISSSIQAVQMLVRVLCVLVLFTCFTPEIWQIQLAALVGAGAAAVLSVYFFKKLIPWFSFRMKDLSFQTSKKLFQAGAWSSVNQIGVLLFLQIDLLTANMMLGASEAGKYAAIIQFPLLLRSLAGTLASLFAPVITSYYSKGDMEGLVKYANQAVRLNGLLLALPAALLGGLAVPFLTIWLGPAFAQLAPLLYIHAGYLAVSLAVMPLFYIWTAYNKQKTPALVTLLLGGLNVLLAVTLSGPAHLGLYGITIAGAAALILKNVVFTPLYVSYITNHKKHVFYKGALAPLSAAVFAWAVCKALQLFYTVDSWTSLIATGLVVSCCYAVFAFGVICTKEERQMAIKRLRKQKGAVNI
ncbi:MATE family efflux transporter [Bacillus atrophaeus]|uniref:MATE family efflux transporter n=1 Tax=Bacillus atrophaeus TaxID=1452 RepID=UPI00227DA9D1|nr:MATE family efflux transporter [Bacillus atrophaeus]MCY8913860.1 MATE family efflux transporter [Bacillus atrophaeus]MCY9113181.1 MATE family efflux transporter [Bacillus atrophaeus]MCY9160622.1 MATE family efflux transporter [Bacillus atrophaeus]MEC0925413.1 MATE family efflux transporter [Bacillus atrophaeus]MEC0934437.1 MATE family efflux transporter [Bacillus atrophaeus]